MEVADRVVMRPEVRAGGVFLVVSIYMILTVKDLWESFFFWYC